MASSWFLIPQEGWVFVTQEHQNYALNCNVFMCVVFKVASDYMRIHHITEQKSPVPVAARSKA